jgi:hypothetical protein
MRVHVVYVKSIVVNGYRHALIMSQKIFVKFFWTVIIREMGQIVQIMEIVHILAIKTQNPQEALAVIRQLTKIGAQSSGVWMTYLK